MIQKYSNTSSVLHPILTGDRKKKKRSLTIRHNLTGGEGSWMSKIATKARNWKKIMAA
jgi:hypothetical protein